MASQKRGEDAERKANEREPRSDETNRASLENYWLLLDDLEIHREELRHRANELEEAQSALEAVEDLLAEAPLGYVTIDASGTIRECNPTAGRMLGIDHQTAPGWSLSAFAVPAHKRRLLDHLLKTRKGSEPVKTELALQSRDGTTVHCQLVTRRAPTADGSAKFRTAILDLTDRRHIEEALRTTERRLSAAVEATGAGILELEIPFQGLLYLNHRLAELLGYTRSQLAEPALIPAWVQARLHPEDAELLRGVYLEISARTRESFQGDVRFRHKDGGWRWIRIWAKASPSSEASSINVVGAVMDVTPEKERAIETERRARQLRALAAELSHVEERERRELAIELHDNLAQLLIATKMKLGVLGPFDDENALRQPVEETLELLDRANEMVRSLTLNLSPPILDELGLAPAVSWLAQDIERQFGLEVRLEKRGELALSDPGLRFMLFRSIRELLINAAKHAQTEKAWVLLESEAGGTRIVVEDHGQGFDLDRMRSEGSKGFGLFSIQERFQSSGGEMRVRTAPGQGTTVTLLLANPEESELQPPPVDAVVPARASATPYAVPQRIRVLLADDHEVVRSSLARLLDAQADVEVIGEASDGESAVELARLLTPDVVIMDVTMFGIGGIEATRRISSEHPESRVVGLSMHESDDVALAMKNAGAFEYLLKSSPARYLLETIRKAAVDARRGSS